MDSVYYVAIIRSYYGPKEKLEIAYDERGHYVYFESIEEAREWIHDIESKTYVLAHNEASRPEYVVVNQKTVDWIDNDDDDKYDWDNYRCNSCENQDRKDECIHCRGLSECFDFMSREDIKYVREHAITQDKAEV